MFIRIVVSTILLFSARSLAFAEESVAPDPKAVVVPAWEGWGCSLSWWGVYSDKWSSEDKKEICRRIFSGDADCLGYNICRYNAGGTSPDTDPNPYRWGGKVEVTLDKDGSFHPERDAAQIECLLLARKYSANILEMFVNSPPYWMLKNGNTRGGDKGGENLREECRKEYADWLVSLEEKMQNAYKIQFDYLSPFNEPSAWWWDGAKNGQEGCKIAPDTQAVVLSELRKKLNGSGLKSKIACSDENGAADGYNTLKRLTSQEIGLDNKTIQKLNVHAYNNWDWQDRLRELASENRIPCLWMSEVSHRERENAGYVPNDMRCALPLSRSVVSDIRRLHCSAWIYWQPVEPLQYNLWYHYTYGLMQAGVEGTVEWNGRSWKPGQVVVAKSFYAMMQFTRFIRPGSRIIESGEDWTLAALSRDNKRLTLVIQNDTDREKVYRFDLTKFAKTGSRVQVYRTSDDADNEVFNCRRLTDLPIEDTHFGDKVPARSVTTYLVEGIRL